MFLVIFNFSFEHQLKQEAMMVFSAKGNARGMPHVLHIIQKCS